MTAYFSDAYVLLGLDKLRTIEENIFQELRGIRIQYYESFIFWSIFRAIWEMVHILIKRPVGKWLYRFTQIIPKRLGWVRNTYIIYPIKYAHGFVMLCFVVVALLNCRWIYVISIPTFLMVHDDVIKWKHFLRYWPFVRGIHRSPVNSPHKGQWCFDVFFDLRLNKRLRKHSWGGWVERPSRSLWRHCNELHWYWGNTPVLPK